MVAIRQAAVQGFAASFLPTRQQATRQCQHTSVRMFFGGSSGRFPVLYGGWFKKTGQIEKDIVAGAKSALRYGVEAGSFSFLRISLLQIGYLHLYHHLESTAVALSLFISPSLSLSLPSNGKTAVHASHPCHIVRNPSPEVYITIRKHE